MKHWNTTTSPDLLLIAAMSLVLTTTFVAASWNQYGGDQGNTHRSFSRGPGGSISTTYEFEHPTATGDVSQGYGGTQITCTDNDEYIITSYDNQVHVFDNVGSNLASLDLSSSGVSAGLGTRAAALFDHSTSMIYFGTEASGFFEVEMTLSAGTYSLTVANVDTTVGVIESPATQAGDGTIYVAEQWGSIHRFSGDPLTLIATYTVGEVVTGGIAIFECDSSSPGKEILVATRDGNLYCLSHDLSTNLWTNTDGSTAGDQYYAGVTVAGLPGSGSDPLALMTVSGATSGSYSGGVRAINLNTQATEGIFEPSNSTIGSDEIFGSVAVLHPDSGNRWATVASSDGYLYAFDLLNVANEMWNVAMVDPTVPTVRPGYGTPAVGRHNAVYVLNDTQDLQIIDGNTGSRMGLDSTLHDASGGAIGDSIIGETSNLAVTVGNGAHLLYR